MAGRIYTCIHCERLFKPDRLARKYCSTSCYGKSLEKSKVDCICEVCASPFQVFPSDIQYGRGKTCSRTCYHKWYSGERHHNWKGGISPEQEILRKSTGTRPWRRAVLKRDNYECVLCGSDERLEADHIRPWSLFPELRYNVDNGRTLCHSCHIKTPTYGMKKK